MAEEYDCWLDSAGLLQTKESANGAAVDLSLENGLVHLHWNDEILEVSYAKDHVDRAVLQQLGLCLKSVRRPVVLKRLAGQEWQSQNLAKASEALKAIRQDERRLRE